MADNKYLKAMQQAKAGTANEPPKPTPEVLEQQPTRRKATRSVGRPPGKRSNPDWEQVTLFVRKDTKRAVLRRLMEDESGRDLSEVIEHLLARWAKT